MTDDNVSFSPTKVKTWIGVVTGLVALVAAGWGYGSSYHSQFAISAEIYTLAIQDKEDQLALIEFKESVGSATPEDQSNKARIVRRLTDLKKKLEE